MAQCYTCKPSPEGAYAKTFLQAHWAGLAAADLLTVEVLTLAGLRRHFVFFVIELQTCRIQIAGIHPYPSPTGSGRRRWPGI